MNEQQEVAFQFPCRLAAEAIHPRFSHKMDTYSIVLSVNSGYEPIEQKYGAPVWHASAASTTGFGDKHFLRQQARKALRGVGDARLGEWEEWSGTAYHVRRRVSSKEQEVIGEAIDIRGTREAVKRREAVQRFLPAHMRDWIE